MKQTFLLFYFCVAFWLAGTSLSHGQTTRALDSESGVFYLKTGDGIESYTVDGSVVFKCTKDGTVPKYRDAGVCFKPKNPGDIIRITVEEIDIDGQDCYLRLFNDSVYIGYSMPSSHFAQIGSTNNGQIYTSSADNGKLTIGFHSPNKTLTYTGWTIKVESITPPPMSYQSANVFLNKTQVNRGGLKQVLLGIKIVTEGKSNPLVLKKLSFASAFPENSVSPCSIYSTGNQASFSESTEVSNAQLLQTNTELSLDLELKSGDNYLWLAGDIHPDAIPGESLPVSLTGLTVGEEDKTPEQTSPELPATISPDILLQKRHLNYTISGAANFYDDGGKDGKISPQFEGTITFVPASEGKKIKIDFSKLEIFNTSTTGYNDILKFYNGRNIDESQLITTLLKETEIIKSTAADGSLTVSLKSTTGVPANGWEAIVSEFEPGNMTYDTSIVEPASSDDVSGENIDEPFLILNIKTTNTENPLVLQSLTIDAVQSSNLQAIAKAKVYFLGKKNTFSTTQLFGETQASENSIFIVSGEQALVEGNNYFAICYDLSQEASNKDSIAAHLNSITLSGTELEASPLLVKRAVLNKYASVLGNYTRHIHDTWSFVQKRPSLPEKGEQITSFIPTSADAVAEIAFSSFDVYYSSTSYGAKSRFEIYSGSTIDADRLLWKVDNQEKASAGPGNKLRSTAADGALTIVYDTKESTSAYVGKGWEASIRPYVNHPMSIDSIAVYQENTSPLKPGGSKQEILHFTIETEGTLTTQTLKQIKVNMKGAASVVDKLSVWYATANEPSEAIEFGSLTDFQAEEVLVAGEQELPEGISYFWLTYDIKPVVENDVPVDASLVSIETNTGTFVPTNGDPEGFRPTKNQLELAAGDNGQVTIYNPVLFYDNGGTDGEYALNFDGTITFLPSDAEKVIKLTFNSFKTASSHYFYVYSGTEEEEEKLLGKYSWNTFPTTLLSESEDGAITVRFVSPSSGYTYEGWEIKVESYTLQDLFIEQITTSAVTTSDVLRGAENAPMQRIAVQVGGDRGSLPLNRFKFSNAVTTNASDILAAGLYYTGSSTGFIADRRIADKTATAPFIFQTEEDVLIELPGTYYFWLTYDIKADALPENKVAVSLEELYAQGELIANIEETSLAERSIRSGFKGDYTIGSSVEADYPSFATAIAAMQEGVEGKVTFKIEAGTYAENIRIKGIQGTSAANNITFTSLSGENDDVVISGSGYSEPPYGAQKYGMVAIDSTEHVTFENMSFVPNVQTYPYAVHLLYTSRYFTLRNCIVTATPLTNTSSGMSLFRMEARNVEGQNNDYVTVENNSFNGGYIALYMGGTSYVALTKERGAIIRNNTINDAGSKGIYLMDEEGALVENNTIISSATKKTGYIGIDIFRNRGAFVVRNNKIVNNQAFYSTGINLRQETKGNTEEPALVYNNSIALTASPTASSYGIDLVSDGSNIAFYHNTINISGTGGYAFGISKTYDNIKNIRIQNNLIQNNTASPVYYVNKESQLKALTLSNNAYYLAGDKFSNNWGDELSSWAVKLGETGSLEEQAQFVSLSDLHLKELGKLNAGIPLAFITSDADGKTRNISTPTLGAYEYEEIVVVAPEIAEGYPKAGNSTYDAIQVKTKWTESGALYSLIKEAGEQAPSKEELLARNAVTVTKELELATDFGQLKEQMAYKAYFLLISDLGASSEIINTEAISTIKRIYPLEVELPEAWDWVEAGTEVLLYPVVSGGVYPYSYKWTNAKGEILSTDSTLTVSPEKVSRYHLKVSDQNNTSLLVYSDIYVNGEAFVATFDDLALAPETYWRGIDTESMESVFYSGSYAFSNTYSSEYDFWGGFAYSNITNTYFDPANMLEHQFRSVTGKGVDGSDNFGIAYPFGARTEIQVMHNMEEGDIIAGVYLTNSAYTYHSITQGDAIAGDPFTTGDYYKVTFKGIAADKTEKSIDYYLADYRSENTAEHYIVTDWKWVDLSSLGKIIQLKLSVSGSRTGSWGLNTPAYLCLDNLGSDDPSGNSGAPQPPSISWNIFPVPAKDVLHIRAAYEQYSIKVFNLLGKLMIQEKGQGDTSLHVAALPKGSYVLELVSPEGRWTKQFVKE